MTDEERFEEWYETYERDGGELMLFNTLDLEAAYEAGLAEGRRMSAEIAENIYKTTPTTMVNNFPLQYLIAAAIRGKG